MHIVGMIAENYKRIRVVEITPKGRVVQITGKNGQGKTSVLDAIWAALVGGRAIPEKPVRKGAEKAKIRLNLGDFTVTRTIAPTGTHTLTVENAKGVKVASPQAILDELLGTLTFDPLAFIGMKPKNQVEMLRQVAKLDIDIDAMNLASKTDYDTRTVINREADRLAAEIGAIVVQAGLPSEKLDEKTILEKLTTAGEHNQKANDMFLRKQGLLQRLEEARRSKQVAGDRLEAQKATVAELEKKLKTAKKELKDLEDGQVEFDTTIDAAQKVYDEAPESTQVDVAELTQQLQTAQLTNREIDKWAKRKALEEKLQAQRREADVLTRAIERREEEKRTALANAKLPVEGLAFNENEATYNGIPIEQLGEAEQIRVSTSIAMAANPQLRILRILHGEALDDDSMKVLAEMAEANDFQIWMAKVDSSGKVGIVMEDGQVKEAINAGAAN